MKITGDVRRYANENRLDNETATKKEDLRESRRILQSWRSLAPNVMRALVVTLSILLCAVATFAGDIREFDIETVKRLGRELARSSSTANKGATTPDRKRARETAIAALKGQLYKIDYHQIVLDDPDGSGFLVYALAHAKDEIILGGHFRVTVSADGSKAERVDALSNTLLRQPPPPKGHEGEKPLTVSMSQIVSNRPLETCVYTSLHDKVIVSVGMANDNAKVWMFVGDQIFEMTPEMMKQIEQDSKKEKKK